MPSETSLQPSPEQEAIIAARRADPGSSLRVLAFAGTGKTTALHLLAEADTTPALYLAYNKSTQLERAGLGNLDRGDEWSFCLTAARMAAGRERR